MQHPYVNPYYGGHPSGMLWADNVKKLYDMIWLESCYASQYAQQGKRFYFVLIKGLCARNRQVQIL